MIAQLNSDIAAGKLRPAITQQQIDAVVAKNSIVKQIGDTAEFDSKACDMPEIASSAIAARNTMIRLLLGMNNDHAPKPPK